MVTEATWLDPNDKDSLTCSTPADSHVFVTGATVVAIDRFDEVADGADGNVYVQDTKNDTSQAEYDGVTVFAPSFTPPDLRIAEGDVMDILGTYTEFLGPSSGAFGGCKSLPEIGGAMTPRFEGSDLAPRTLPLQEIIGYARARRFMGMLVRLENIQVAKEMYCSNDALATGGRCTSDIDLTGLDLTDLDAGDVPRISNELFDLKNEVPELGTATATTPVKIKAVTGVLTYFYGFKVAPRSRDDVEL